MTASEPTDDQVPVDRAVRDLIQAGRELLDALELAIDRHGGAEELLRRIGVAMGGLLAAHEGGTGEHPPDDYQQIPLR